MTTSPRDPYSEVVHTSRRWTPEWYQWLSELTDDVTALEDKVASNVPGVATFTPQVHFGGGAVGLTYNTQLGVYQRVGKIILGGLHVRLNNKGSSTGGAAISIPVTANGFVGADVGIGLTTFFAGIITPIAGPIFGYVGTGFNDMVLRMWTNTGMPVFDDTMCSNNFEVYMNFVYLAA